MVTGERQASCMKVGERLGCVSFFIFGFVFLPSAGRETCGAFAWCLLPSDSPPCSWPEPAAAAAPPRRWSEVGPAPGPRRREETRTTLLREARSGLSGEHGKSAASGVQIWDRVQRQRSSGVLRVQTAAAQTHIIAMTTSLQDYRRSSLQNFGVSVSLFSSSPLSPPHTPQRRKSQALAG